MGQFIEYAQPDGAGARAYWAAAQPARGAVVILHEWWGLNAQICAVADRLAQAGWAAMAPDWMGGRVTTDPAVAQRWAAELDAQTCITQTLAGAVQACGAAHQPVVLWGFCLGGALALRAAARVAGLSGVVSFYGLPEPDALDPRAVQVPVLFHGARRDRWCTPARVRTWSQAMQAAGHAPTVYWYEADHAFFNDTRAEVFDPVSAALAWTRTLAFLNALYGDSASPA
jgi:carboxymethylenebutenolidase